MVYPHCWQSRRWSFVLRLTTVIKPGPHYGCMQPARRLRAGCIRLSPPFMPASTPCILRRRCRDADRNNTPWMNTSICFVFLRSYFSICSHNVIWHAHSTQCRRAVGMSRRLPKTLKMAKLTNLQLRPCDRLIIKVCRKSVYPSHTME